MALAVGLGNAFGVRVKPLMAGRHPNAPEEPKRIGHALHSQTRHAKLERALEGDDEFSVVSMDPVRRTVPVELQPKDFGSPEATSPTEDEQDNVFFRMMRKIFT